MYRRYSETSAAARGVSRGGMPSSGVLATGSLHQDPPMLPGHHMYHRLLQMPQHRWELAREAASQMLGRPPSPMWGAMHVQGPATGGRQTLTAIAATDTPQDAARAVEAEGRPGGDMTLGLHHVLAQTARMR